MVETIAALAAIAIGVIVIVWLVKVVKSTILAGLGIAVILLLLSLLLGITPEAIVEAGQSLIDTVSGWLPGSDGSLEGGQTLLQKIPPVNPPGR